MMNYVWVVFDTAQDILGIFNNWDALADYVYGRVYFDEVDINKLQAYSIFDDFGDLIPNNSYELFDMLGIRKYDIEDLNALFTDSMLIQEFTLNYTG